MIQFSVRNSMLLPWCVTEFKQYYWNRDICFVGLKMFTDVMFISTTSTEHIITFLCRTKNYTELETRIREDLRPFLYNGGEGMMVPIEQLVAIRQGKKYVPDDGPKDETQKKGW
jgi:hypothetical protein